MTAKTEINTKKAAAFPNLKNSQSSSQTKINAYRFITIYQIIRQSSAQIRASAERLSRLQKSDMHPGILS